ncbi:MAG: hypothetical protein OXE99_07435 [Cellvibrionales bacterium]|nr:hypothetical protein [Cellvibrionales bacterium]
MPPIKSYLIAASASLFILSGCDDSDNGPSRSEQIYTKAQQSFPPLSATDSLDGTWIFIESGRIQSTEYFDHLDTTQTASGPSYSKTMVIVKEHADDTISLTSCKLDEEAPFQLDTDILTKTESRYTFTEDKRDKDDALIEASFIIADDHLSLTADISYTYDEKGDTRASSTIRGYKFSESTDFFENNLGTFTTSAFYHNNEAIINQQTDFTIGCIEYNEADIMYSYEPESENTPRSATGKLTGFSMLARSSDQDMLHLDLTQNNLKSSSTRQGEPENNTSTYNEVTATYALSPSDSYDFTYDQGNEEPEIFDYSIDSLTISGEFSAGLPNDHNLSGSFTNVRY